MYRTVRNRARVGVPRREADVNQARSLAEVFAAHQVQVGDRFMFGDFVLGVGVRG